MTLYRITSRRSRDERYTSIAVLQRHSGQGLHCQQRIRQSGPVTVDEGDELYNNTPIPFDPSCWPNDECNVQLNFNGKTNFGAVGCEPGRAGITKHFKGNFRANLANMMNFFEETFVSLVPARRIASLRRKSIVSASRGWSQVVARRLRILRTSRI
jgi:hypothetical protein